ncbi:MAG TPA: pyridoxal phosphate-dependent aminotransferase [Thermoanaerobaculia bacterium]|nr:pyridoxal phosphate-dependent aminotransferase [Thermoanaerobaculia bacterium]
MPRPPGRSVIAATLRGSPYSSLLARMAAHPGEIFPLHVGDTWKTAPEGGRPEELPRDIPGVNRYTDVRGLPELRDAIAERMRARTGATLTRGNVLVTGGATAGLMAAVGALVSPGEEVLLLSPRWPLIEGHVRMAGATPVEVPLLLGDLSPGRVVEALEENVTVKTVALYVNTPSNPTGRVIPRTSLVSLLAWAERRDVWILEDDVYEDYAYAGEHVSTLALASGRTVSAHSLSKAYGLAGARCGWLTAPERALDEIVKLSAHTVYSAPTASQHAALRILAGAGDAWVEEARAEYAATGAEAARRLGVPAPEGGSFLFVDVAQALDARGLAGFLEDCSEEGLFLAPGPSFGPFPTYVRICFTAVPPEKALRGVDILARKLGR